MQIKRTSLVMAFASLFWLSTVELPIAQPQANTYLPKSDVRAADSTIGDLPEDMILVDQGVELTSDLPLHPEFLISDGFGYGFSPAMAYNSQRDEYFVVWGDPFNLYGRRVSSRGELLGTQFNLSSSVSRDISPSVAYDPVNNRYLVVWSREITSENWDIYGRFIPWDGNVGTAEFLIDSSTTDTSSNPQVVYANTPQEYLVVWEDYTTGWPQYKVTGRRIIAVGGGWPPKFIIASNPSQNRRHPDVAYNQITNHYLVTFDNYYYSPYTTTNENIYGQRLNWDGVFLGSEFSIASWAEDELVSAVSSCFNQYLVSWKSVHPTETRVYGRYVDYSGAPQSVHLMENSSTGSPYEPPVITCKGGYQYMVVWEKLSGGSGVGISGRIAQLNEALEPAIEIATPVYPQKESPALACSGANCLVAWEKRDSSGYAEINGRIVGETKPKAVFTVTPTSGTFSTVFNFDASGSSDLETPAANLVVRWDWNNDGSFDTGWSTTKTATHQFMIPCSAASANITIRMEVRDSYGLTDSTTRQITLNNTPPTAAFLVSPEVGTNSTPFYFDASTSNDAECVPSLVQVRWDWNNDSVWDTAWSTTKTALVTFGSLSYGFNTIKLEVKDGAGMTHSTTRMIKIDNPPTASFTVNPPSGTTDTLFEFDPRSSTDPDVGSQPYYHLYARWDWNNDGSWDTDWKMCWEVISHQFNTPATHTVRLEVRESWPSLTDTTTRQVMVEQGNNPPTASFTVQPAIGTTTTAFTFNASASSDVEDSTSALEVRWDWENDAIFDTNWSTNKIANHQFSTNGVHIVRLIVRDTGGLTAQTTRQVTVGDQTFQYLIFLPRISE